MEIIVLLILLGIIVTIIEKIAGVFKSIPNIYKKCFIAATISIGIFKVLGCPMSLIVIVGIFFIVFNIMAYLYKAQEIENVTKRITVLYDMAVPIMIDGEKIYSELESKFWDKMMELQRATVRDVYNNIDFTDYDNYLKRYYELKKRISENDGDEQIILKYDSEKAKIFKKNFRSAEDEISNIAYRYKREGKILETTKLNQNSDILSSVLYEVEGAEPMVSNRIQLD